VVVAAPELGPTNASAVDPDVLGLTGDFRRIEDVMPNVSINDAGPDSFEDVYTVRGLNNTPNFSKQALIISSMTCRESVRLQKLALEI